MHQVGSLPGTDPYDVVYRNMPSTYDAAFGVLADRHRRRLLFELMKLSHAEEPIDPIALLEGTLSERTEVNRILLHHAHLPKLDHAGFVTWDREAGTIARGPDWETIAPLLEVLADHAEELPEAVTAPPAIEPR